MLSSILGTGDTEVNQADQSPGSQKLYILVEEGEQTSEMKQVQTKVSAQRH